MLRKAFRVTVPVLLGYLAIGIAFGLLLRNAGYPWWLAPVMSALVYAGALQYLAIGLLAAHASLWEAALLALVVNARHMVYGLSLLDRYGRAGWRKLYLIFALTDETYALVTSTEAPGGVDPTGFYATISLLNHSYWVAGSAIGAIAGSLIPYNMTGLDFALTALFIVLVVEQFGSATSKLPFLLAALSAAGAYFLVGPKNMLLVSIAGSVVLLLLFRKEVARDVAR